MEKIAYETVAPVLTEYTKWVLSDCHKKGLKKVYFLARDGYSLLHIANEICKQNNFDIECKYLYCSRYSLRIPSYHLIGDEAFKKLFLKGYYYSAINIFKRAGLSDKEISEFSKEFKIEGVNASMSEVEFEELTKKLSSSDKFREKVLSISKNSFENAIAYFKEQGVFDSEEVVIVDSGWAGSMQRTLRQLLDGAGYKGKIIGYYFGLVCKQKEEDGEYNTYYFNCKKGLKRRIMFNNNVFECMMSANHGMTMGYQKKNGKMQPILNDYENAEMQSIVETQIEFIKKFAKENDLSCKDYNLKKSLKKTYKLLKSFMVYPTSEEVDVFGKFMFCDDVTENYHMSLADKRLTKALKQHMIIPRIFNKILRRKKTTEPLFWPYAIVVFQPKILRPWYRLNLFVWYLISYILH